MKDARERAINVKDTFQKLCRAEESLIFFQFSLCGIPVWIYPRERALLAAANMTRPGEQSFSAQRINWVNLLKRLFYFLVNIYKLADNDLIIFTNERHLQKSPREGGYYNPYAELVLEKKKAKRALIFEFPTPMTSKFRQAKYPRYLPLDFFLVLKQVFSPLARFYARKVKQEFGPKLFQANLWSKEAREELLRFTVWSAYNIKVYYLFLRFIKALNPKAKLFYSCIGGFDKFPEVIEIQHGVIHEIHSQYIFPQTSAILPYLKSKKTIVFSQRVKDLFVRNGYLPENIEVEPNSKIKFYFRETLGPRSQSLPLSSKKMVIVSDWGGHQHQIFKQFVLEIERNKELFQGWEIPLVLHPTEKNVYKGLNLTKVKVFENHQISLWQELAQALCMVTISSTVLEEAAYFGCFDIVLEDKEFLDQKTYLDWLIADYPHKVAVAPNRFIEWFKENKERLISHFPTKKKIISENYQRFLGQSSRL